MSANILLSFTSVNSGYKMLKLSEKAKIIKNVLIISLAFFFEWTAYNGIANLQSSLNSNVDFGPIGTNSLAITYGFSVLSCLFLPTLVIKKLGLKEEY